MFVDNSLDWVLSQIPLWGTLVRILGTLSLTFAYSRRMTLVLRRPLHIGVSDRNVLGIFVPLPPAVLIGFTHETNIALEAGLAKFCFSVLCASCFTHGNKALWFLFHVVWGRCDFKGFIFTFCFLFLSDGCFQATFTQWGIWVPIENADVSWRYFPGRSSLIPIWRALSPRKSWTFSFMLPYTRDMVFFEISLDRIVSQRPLCGTLIWLSWPHTLTFPNDEGWG